MTRKDFILIAKVLKEAYDEEETKNGLRALSSLIDNMAASLKEDNPSFDVNKWYSFLGCRVQK